MCARLDGSFGIQTLDGLSRSLQDSPRKNVGAFRKDCLSNEHAAAHQSTLRRVKRI